MRAGKFRQQRRTKMYIRFIAKRCGQGVKKETTFNQEKKLMRNLLVVSLALISIDLIAQVNFPPLSPQGSIRQKVGVTTISVIYERPAARGRKVFGELVPYNKLWRTGAGNCTKIKFDEDVLREG